MKRIVADIKRCTGCKTCVLSCAVAHVDADDLAEAIEQGARPRIHVEKAGTFAVPLQCRHCEDAPCIRVCPSGALVRLSDGAPVLERQERCIGCGFCVQACPFGVIRIAAGSGPIVKCDLCIKRQAKGMQPACVSDCPTSTLSLADVEDDSKRRRVAVSQQVAGEE